MGNAIIPGKRRTARVMKVDGSTRKYRPPAVAGDALRDHPGHYHLLESEEVRRLGMRARPMDPDAPLKPGKLYFLVDLPRLAPPSTTRVPRRTWSGALTYGGGPGGTTASGGGAGERLESLMLARRSASDVAATVKAMAAAGASPACSATLEEEDGGGAVRLRVRLPKAEVARLVKESRDAADAAERIMRLCVDRDQHRHGGSSAPATPVLMLPPPAPAVLPLPAIASSTRNKQKPPAAKKEKRARFVTMPDEIIGF